MGDAAGALPLAAGALAVTPTLMDGLEVDAARMRENLDATHGLIMAEAVTMALGGEDRPASRRIISSSTPAKRAAAASGTCARC